VSGATGVAEAKAIADAIKKALPGKDVKVTLSVTKAEAKTPAPVPARIELIGDKGEFKGTGVIELILTPEGEIKGAKGGDLRFTLPLEAKPPVKAVPPAKEPIEFVPATPATPGKGGVFEFKLDGLELTPAPKGGFELKLEDLKVAPRKPVPAPPVAVPVQPPQAKAPPAPDHTARIKDLELKLELLHRELKKAKEGKSAAPSGLAPSPAK
ncbi:MAG: hypothetical protein K2W96_02200, partial [Gemmataceae bacterium]|nr:hypothetical protein [Gemmataceae bacterium]